MKMHDMVVVVAAACVLALGAQSARCQAIADRGEQRAPERGMARGMGRVNQPSEEELDSVMAFMREHSPHRVKALESLPEDSAARRGVTAFVVARYRALQAVKDEDAKLYDIKVKQAEIEDELYGLLGQTRSAADREKMRDQIRLAAKRQVEQNFAEREQRLSRLRESMQREQQKLDADRAQIDSLADTRATMLVQEGASALRRETMRRGPREETRQEGREGRRDGRPAGATTRPVEK